MTTWRDEKEYKRDFAEAMRYYGMQTQEHEDKFANFIPDLSFANGGIEGWIEVKYCHDMPKTLDSLEHWTAGQEQWLVERGRAGTGWSFLLVGTPQIHALFRYGCLSSVRMQPFEVALNSAWDKDYTYPRLVERLASRARRRVLVGVDRG
jgi:hypothetical protein